MLGIRLLVDDAADLMLRWRVSMVVVSATNVILVSIHHAVILIYQILLTETEIHNTGKRPFTGMGFVHYGVSKSEGSVEML